MSRQRIQAGAKKTRKLSSSPSIPRLFARLTALLEDAAALAAEGQRHSLTKTQRRRIAAQLRRDTEAAGKIISKIQENG